jgi:hypothetical protein
LHRVVHSICTAPEARDGGNSSRSETSSGAVSQRAGHPVRRAAVLISTATRINPVASSEPREVLQERTLTTRKKNLGASAMKSSRRRRMAWRVRAS